MGPKLTEGHFEHDLETSFEKWQQENQTCVFTS